MFNSTMFHSSVRIFKASYPPLWLYTGFLFLLGGMAATKQGLSLPGYFWAYLAWFFVGANLFGMLLNDYYDRALDAHNPRKRQERLHPAEYAWGIAAGLGSYALLTYCYPLPETSLWVGLAVLTNLLYSMPPIRLKEWPLFDLAVGPGSYFTAILAGYAAAGGGLPSSLALCAGILFFSGIDLAFKTLDIEADMQGGITTSAVALGRSKSIALSLFLIAAAGCCIGIYRPAYILGILPYLAIVALIYKARSTDARSALDSALPRYYLLAGFTVTFVWFWFG